MLREERTRAAAQGVRCAKGSVIAYLKSTPCLQTGAIGPHLNENTLFAPRYAASPICTRPRIYDHNCCCNSSHLFANRQNLPKPLFATQDATSVCKQVPPSLVPVCKQEPGWHHVCKQEPPICPQSRQSVHGSAVKTRPKTWRITLPSVLPPIHVGEADLKQAMLRAFKSA